MILGKRKHFFVVVSLLSVLIFLLFEPSEHLLTAAFAVIPQQGTTPPGGTTPQPSSKPVFVADTYNNGIQKFSNSGTFMTKWVQVMVSFIYHLVLL